METKDGQLTVKSVHPGQEMRGKKKKKQVIRL